MRSSQEHPRLPVTCPSTSRQKGALAPNCRNDAFNVQVPTVLKHRLFANAPSAGLLLASPFQRHLRRRDKGERNRRSQQGEMGAVCADLSRCFCRFLTDSRNCRDARRRFLEPADLCINPFLPFGFSLRARLQKRDAEVLARHSG